MRSRVGVYGLRIKDQRAEVAALFRYFNKDPENYLADGTESTDKINMPNHRIYLG
jgi:hypothetical protein